LSQCGRGKTWFFGPICRPLGEINAKRKRKAKNFIRENIGEREKWFSVQNIDLRERSKKIEGR
jgi:hypothetical protein